MVDYDEYIKPEDYEEPSCVLCMDDSSITPIDKRRFIEKLDSYYGKNDYDGALRHLKYWLAEAEAGNDLRGQFTIYNEMMGYYRKTGDRENAVAASDKALSLVEKLNLENTTAAGTAYVNKATVYKTFNESDKAMPWFLRALQIYEKQLDKTDSKLGGLYNNMALSLSDLQRYGEAMEYYNKALDVMKNVKNGELEMAITYLNMANAKEAEVGAEQAEDFITSCIEKAISLLETSSLPHDGYYAFVCEKSAPTFEYYGYFLYAKQLKEISNKIYEGN